MGVIYTLRKLQRWERDPALRPVSMLQWSRQILLPLVPNLSLAAAFGYFRSTGFLRYLQLFNPDVALVSRTSGVLAGIWSLLRTGLMLQASRGAERRVSSVR